MNLKPYPEYQESGVPWLGKVPQGWEHYPGMAVLREKQIKNTGLKEKTILSLSYGRIKVKSQDKLHGLVPESFETYQIVEPGDIIIRATDLQNDKTSLRTGKVKDKGIITSAYLCLKTQSSIDKDYAHSLLHALDIMKVYYGMGSGLRQNLSWTDFKRMPFFIPPLLEQTQIARFLDWKTSQIAHFIKAKKRMIELLKEQKQVIINDAVTGKIDVSTGKPYPKYKDSSVEWLGQVPEGWEVRKIYHLFKTIGSGTTPESGNTTFYENGDIPWIITGDLNDGVLSLPSKKITENALKKFSVLKKYPIDSIIIAMYGATIGKTSKITFEACTNQACCVLANPRNLISVDYTLNLFIAIKPVLVQKGYGGGQPNINQDIIKSLRIPLPDLIIQKDIVKYISNKNYTLDSSIDIVEREIALMQEYRDRLMADVVTGKVDVRGIEVPEVVEELVEDNGDIPDDEIDKAAMAENEE